MVYRSNRNTIESILARLEPVTESGCWLWVGGTSHGYGCVGYNGRVRPVHRIIFEHFRGQIPPHLQLDHLCRVKCCANPNHLDVVTSRENTLRGIGVASQYAKAMYCVRGHLLSDENVYTYKLGRRRQCKTCVLMRQRWYRHPETDPRKVSQEPKEGQP